MAVSYDSVFVKNGVDMTRLNMSCGNHPFGLKESKETVKPVPSTVSMLLSKEVFIQDPDMEVS